MNVALYLRKNNVHNLRMLGIQLEKRCCEDGTGVPMSWITRSCELGPSEMFNETGANRMSKSSQ